MKAQLNSIISATFLTSFWTRILKIKFSKYGIWSVYIVKSLSYFCCEANFIIFPRTIIALFSRRLLASSLVLYRKQVLPTRFLFLSISLIVAVSFWYQDGFQGKDGMRLICSNLYIFSVLANPLISVRVNDILTTISVLVAA